MRIREDRNQLLREELTSVLERLDPALGGRVRRLLDETKSAREAGARPIRVLVVDDSQACRILTTRLLCDAGYEVRSAVDGLEAWDLLQERSFDVVVSDLQMPEMGGLALLKKVRTSGLLSDLPVILNTGVGDRRSRDAALAAGANDYITKSVSGSRSLLLDSVARWSRGAG